MQGGQGIDLHGFHQLIQIDPFVPLVWDVAVAGVW
jgi:hypothetical protein